MVVVLVTTAGGSRGDNSGSRAVAVAVAVARALSVAVAVARAVSVAVASRWRSWSRRRS
jgi:hypothetical protein